MQPTVYLAKDELGRWTTAGWVWDRKVLPEGAWFRNAEGDGVGQIAEWVRDYPISRVVVRVKHRPAREYTVEEWLRTFRDRSITRL